jgi:hypothetical protein
VRRHTDGREFALHTHKHPSSSLTFKLGAFLKKDGGIIEAIDYNKPPVHSMSLGCWLPCRIQDSRCWRASMGRLASYSPLESAFELSQLNWFFQIISA